MARFGFTPIIFVVIVAVIGLAAVFAASFKKSTKTQPLPIKTDSSAQIQQFDPSTITPIIDSEIAEEENQPELPSRKLLGTVSGSNYTALVFDLASTTIITDTAGDGDCSDNCPTKALAQYIKDNGARGGMNGTYFCPPDYNWCAGKINSYDFPVWNNRKKKWMQASKLFWGGRGMMVFRSGSAQFYSDASSAGAPSDITGGIINYPSLLAQGQLVLNEGSLSDNLKVTKGTRSGIGFGNGKLFLVVARRSNMKDLAIIFQSLGATDALNLDGGGSVALYENGRYKVGPGRSLPNAIIIK